ncbi:ATP-binding cassette domain-containing protein [Devosia sp. XJ19-1]|uniref:ATP-binding cassette domain-containing protein n=1 Tax=Devosia ureilytica TaxID=2952754 RepID=A0A9Q4ANL5_9HYPH|nr:ATP-binding cassette domain-containing protein [Devosia ureilytica]MCP8882731.1 ATP-binding cassette domain-containing protein [Devosia ureilytica]MCP8886901.1 ATP-binding cassette domain-containing protein [Devosia ureilytica]
MPTVSFEHIVKSYGSMTVLNDLNLSVDDGDFLVLLGPSGCGKTTLLNLLAGLLEVSDGRIMIGDRDVTDLDPKDRGLAMVFQSYALYPTKTVHGNLKFGLSASKLPRDEIEKRIAWAARLLQIEPLLNRKPGQLSGGQRQRVAIGRALVKNVGVFLFDEPLSNLDAKLRTEMRLEIKKLHDELKSTIVYVTHDQIEAMTMATRIAVMDGGVIQQFGTPDEIYERPANLFVAGFIGSPAMNLREATLNVSNDRITAQLASGVVLDLEGYDFAETPRNGTKVIVGLRPEHFGAPDVREAKAAATFTLPVQYTERTGSDATVYLKLDNQLLALRVAPDAASRLKPGTSVSVDFLSGKANLFDAQTGRRM